MVGKLSKSKRVIFIVITLILVMGITMIYESGASADSTHKSAKNQTDHKHFAQDDVKKVELISISDRTALNLVERSFGKEIATRAKHRVTIPIEGPEIQYTIDPQNEISKVWCGYSLVNDDLDSVRANYNASHCSGYDASDATWVGVGGRDNHYLIQTGINQDNMLAWWEVYPYNDAQWMFKVNQGDEIHSTVQKWYGNTYYICTVDATTGDYFTWTVRVTPDPAGVGNWIVETPLKAEGGQYHIGDFDTVTFTDALWWGADHRPHGINYAGEHLYREIIYTIHNETMHISPLSGNGTSFSIYPD